MTIKVKCEKTVVCLMLFFGMLTSVCFASVTPTGVSGLINIPSAYTARYWKVNVGYFNTSSGESLAGNVSLPFDAEFSYSRYWLDEKKDVHMFSFKVPLLKETVLKPAVAIGLEDVTDRFDRNYYLVVSKQGPFGFRLHLGARGGDRSGVFYGLEKQIRLKGELEKQTLFIPVLNLMAEYDGHDFNYGFYVRNKKGFRVDFAWHDDAFRAGFQYEF